MSVTFFILHLKSKKLESAIFFAYKLNFMFERKSSSQDGIACTRNLHKHYINASYNTLNILTKPKTVFSIASVFLFSSQEKHDNVMSL